MDAGVGQASLVGGGAPAGERAALGALVETIATGSTDAFAADALSAEVAASQPRPPVDVSEAVGTELAVGVGVPTAVAPVGVASSGASSPRAGDSNAPPAASSVNVKRSLKRSNESSSDAYSDACSDAVGELGAAMSRVAPGSSVPVASRPLGAPADARRLPCVSSPAEEALLEERLPSEDGRAGRHMSTDSPPLPSRVRSP